MWTDNFTKCTHSLFFHWSFLDGQEKILILCCTPAPQVSEQSDQEVKAVEKLMFKMLYNRVAVRLEASVWSLCGLPVLIFLLADAIN